MKKPISTTVVLATIVGALPLVGGLGAIFLNFRYHYNDPVFGPASAALTGLLLIIMTSLGASPGRYQHSFVFVRNALLFLLCTAVLLALVLVLLGPMH